MRVLKKSVLMLLALLPHLVPAQSGKHPIPLPYVREADVMWSKKVWQAIDLREKFNQTLYYPLNTLSDRRSLFDIIKEGVLPPEATSTPVLSAYSPDENELKTRLTRAELKKLFTTEDTVFVPDSIHPDILVPRVVRSELGPADVKQYWLQEEWVFDKQRSVLDVRITAIMPVISKKNEKGEVIGMGATFWIYFPEMRELLVKNYIFNRKNSAHLLTFDDLFLKRMFSCYIIKEDNVADRMIAEYKGANTLDALLEAESIKNGMLFKESDMWHH
jgi:gliding motility associated protien GldN